MSWIGYVVAASAVWSVHGFRAQSGQFENRTPRQNKLIDATPLFVGRRVSTIPIALENPTPQMCCCKKLEPECILKPWSKSSTCSKVAGRSFQKFTNEKRVGHHRFRCLIDKLIFGRAARMLASASETEAQHPKIDSHWPGVPNPSRPVQGKIYLVRHGQSAFNVLMEEAKGAKAYMKGELKDAQLTPKGQDQAVVSQELFKRLFKDVSVDSIQLVASLLSRAYDTLLLATHHVWTTWNRTDYVVDQLPAIMEFGGGVDVNRVDALLDSAPVRWEDSSLPKGGLRYNEQEFAQHYEASDDGNWMTADPWQVQSGYPRRGTSKNCDKNDDQLKDVLLYLQNKVSSGKRHVVVGSHSLLILCFMRYALKTGIIQGLPAEAKNIDALWQDGSGETFDVYAEKIDNGEVLSFDLSVSTGGRSQTVISNIGLSSPSRGFPFIGRMVVKVISGYNLVDMDTMSLSDPFVVLEFGGVESKSQTILDDLNPTWNFVTTVQVASEMQVVRIKICDEDVVGSDFMGDVIIPMHDVMRSSAYSRARLPLKNIEHGEILVSLAFEEFHD